MLFHNLSILVWIDKHSITKYILPFIIEKDVEYRKALEENLLFVCLDIIKAGAKKEFIILVNITLSSITSTRK